MEKDAIGENLFHLLEEIIELPGRDKKTSQVKVQTPKQSEQPTAPKPQPPDPEQAVWLVFPEAPNTGWRKKARMPASLSPSKVQARGRVTAALKEGYYKIYEMKRMIHSRMSLSPALEQWARNLGLEIVTNGLFTAKLNAQEIMAAIFLVAELRRQYVPNAHQTKGYLQRVLVTYHAKDDGCTIEQIPDGRKYAGFWEMRSGLWCTHIPHYFIKDL